MDCFNLNWCLTVTSDPQSFRWCSSIYRWSAQIFWLFIDCVGCTTDPAWFLYLFFLFCLELQRIRNDFYNLIDFRACATDPHWFLRFLYGLFDFQQIIIDSIDFNRFSYLLFFRNYFLHFSNLCALYQRSTWNFLCCLYMFMYLQQIRIDLIDLPCVTWDL